MSVAEDYFALTYLENNPNKLIEWLTDYDTQKLIAHNFETHQVFYRDDGCVLVHKNLLLYYRIWFDTDNMLEELEK